MVEIVLHRKPVALKRPRFVRRGIGVDVINSQKQQMNADYWDIREQYIDPPLSGALDVDLEFVFASKKAGPRTERPDIDNLVKYILDVANGLLWTDDSIVVKLSATKFNGKHNQITIKVREIDHERSTTPPGTAKERGSPTRKKTNGPPS